MSCVRRQAEDQYVVLFGKMGESEGAMAIMSVEDKQAIVGGIGQAGCSLGRKVFLQLE